MLKCFPVLISMVVLLSIFSFVVAAENTEPESFSLDETTSFSVETSSESVSEEFSELSSVSSTFDDQQTIINRLDLIYTLGLFFVSFLVALLVIYILWRVLAVFI